MRNIINRKEDTRVQSQGVPFAPPSLTSTQCSITCVAEF